jgi:hypothetical protein
MGIYTSDPILGTWARNDDPKADLFTAYNGFKEGDLVKFVNGAYVPVTKATDPVDGVVTRARGRAIEDGVMNVYYKGSIYFNNTMEMPSDPGDPNETPPIPPTPAGPINLSAGKTSNGKIIERVGIAGLDGSNNVVSNMGIIIL